MRLSGIYRLAFSDEARTDLALIRLWLLQPGSGRRSHGRYVSIIEAIDGLKAAPHRWPLGEFLRVRERPVEGHRIYYRLDEDARRIRILRIFGPFQDRSAL